MKRFSVWFILTIVIIVLSICGYQVNENYKEGMSRVKYVPPQSNSTLEEVEKKIGEKLIKTKRDNIIFGVAEEPVGIYMGSGPPVYVFDENNILIDYTLDRGDDLEFRRKWYVDTKKILIK